MQSKENKSGTEAGSKGHVLLVSPRTFSYHISISKTLLSMGYSVTWWDERASSATWYKLALRLFPVWAVSWSERSFLTQLGKLETGSISHVLVIKGEGLSKRVAFKIHETFPQASMGLYLWDSVENSKGVFNILPAFNSVATFDPVDAKKFSWKYRPLFWRDISFSKKVPEPALFDWCFVGTIHSDRHRVIHRLRQRDGQEGRSFVFAYFQSPLILFIRRFVDWTLWYAPKGSLSTKPMPAAEVAQKVGSSSAVLDVEHPRQRGLTMRTIETLFAGKKLVTTNEHILKSDLYNPSRVHLISRLNPFIPTEFLSKPFLIISEDLRKYYSCDGWAEELLALQDAAKKKTYEADV